MSVVSAAARLEAVIFVSKRPKISRLCFWIHVWMVFLFLEAIKTPYVPTSYDEHLFLVVSVTKCNNLKCCIN